MAIMHPSTIESYDCTKSEKDLYYAFKEQLPDKMQVFYSVRWFETDENNKRVDSESDFLIFDPSYGFLAVEVKGGIGIRIDDGKWSIELDSRQGSETKRELKCSPYEQAEKSMRHFHSHFVEEFNQSFHGVYGFAVAFPYYAVDNSLSQEAPLEITIDLNNMNALAKKINSIFHYWRNKRNITIPFSSQQRKSFIDLINKQISISAAAGALIPIKEKEFSKIDFVQDSVLDLLYNYNQVKIVGGAGTGKTFIAMKKAIRESNQGKKVLFFSRSKELISFVKLNLETYSNITCCTFDEMMLQLISNLESLKGKKDFTYFEYADSFDTYRKYDTIIVDEAQDFTVDMGLTTRALLKDETHSTLYVFYDKDQNVFDTNFDDAFLITTKPFVLRYNIRNTGAIYKCAVNETDLGKDTIANQLEGVNPEISEYANKSQTLIALSNIVNHLIQKEYVKTTSIIVLTDVPFDNSILANENRIGAYDITHGDFNDVKNNEICVKTAEEFKGMEANIVIYLKQNASNPNDNIQKCKEYVALTRARYYLYILKTRR